MRKCVYIPVLLLLLHAAKAQRPRVLFDHRSYQQFAAGHFSDAGANLYVSQKGRIQFVHLFDLNFDGYPEVVLNNDHNHMEAPDALVHNNSSSEGCT